MREILFRGKRVDIGEWAYGSLIIETNPFDKDMVMTHIYDNFYNEIIVDRRTIGQYTGLKDLHGTRIFEGDIVRFIDIDFDGSERKAVGVIAWNRKAANFDIVKGTYRLDFHYPVFEEIEVIGNVYDNQELLEEDKT